MDNGVGFKSTLLLKFFLFQQKVLDVMNDVLFLKHLVLSRYPAQNASVFKAILRSKRTIETHSDINEIYQIIQAVIATKDVAGDIAEVGVYQGGTAKIIAEYKGNKSLYLFDTFNGFPKIGRKDVPFFRKGMLSTQYKEVKSHFKGINNVFLYKGIFPQETGKYVKDKKFSLVNLDVDLYDSTLNSLRFFYQRINKGGIFVLHDYFAIPAVHKVVNKFFKDKNVALIGVFGSQCLVIKL